MVGIGVVELAQHDQRPAPTAAGERLYDLEDRVVGFDAGDRDQETVGLETQAGERLRAHRIHRHAAIRNSDDRLPAAPRRQMIGDGRVVGDQPVRRAGRNPFVEPEPAADGPAPLRTPPLDPIHVGQNRPSLGPKIGEEDSRVVAEHEAQAVAAGRIERAVPVEVERRHRTLGRDLDMNEFYAPPLLGPQAPAHGLDLMLAIDRDMPALTDQEQTQMLREGFKPAVSGRYPARAHNDHGSSGRHRCSLSLRTARSISLAAAPSLTVDAPTIQTRSDFEQSFSVRGKSRSN